MQKTYSHDDCGQHDIGGAMTSVDPAVLNPAIPLPAPNPSLLHAGPTTAPGGRKEVLRQLEVPYQHDLRSKTGKF